jgi:hypothetical protein
VTNKQWLVLVSWTPSNMTSHHHQTTPNIFFNAGLSKFWAAGVGTLIAVMNPLYPFMGFPAIQGEKKVRESYYKLPKTARTYESSPNW